MMNKEGKIFVLDNNVFIAAAINREGTCAKAILRAESLGVIITSADISSEFFRKISSKKIRHRVSEACKDSLIEKYLEGAVRIPVIPSIQRSRDKKDNMFLDLAVTGKADVIVSGDEDLKMLRIFKGIGHVIPIISPKEFLDLYPEPTITVPGPFSSFFRSVRPE